MRLLAAIVIIEALELKLQGKEPQVMKVEEFGVPLYDELVIVARRDEAHAEKIKKFLSALQTGVAYLKAHPQESWRAFASTHPDLNTRLNPLAWMQTVPLFASNPAGWISRAMRLMSSFYIAISCLKKLRL